MTTKKSRTTHEPVDAIALLTGQHREVEALFAKLEETSERAHKTREQIFNALALAIEGHAQIEEHNFYPAGRSVDPAMTLEAFEEHDVCRYLIEQIKATDPSDETFIAKVTVLKEAIGHHVEEEEGTYFPEVKKALGAERLLELGATMKAEFDTFAASPHPMKPKGQQRAAPQKPSSDRVSMAH